jgi:zinc-binding alcohol dehydrogenase family protein
MSVHSQCMVLSAAGRPLTLIERDLETPPAGHVLLRVRACGVCRTDLHIADGDLREPKLPLVLGHEVVGELVSCGAGVSLAPGLRLGVPWMGWSCGDCVYCKSGQENLCESAKFTGYHLDGGYAQHVVADARYCFELPPTFDDAHAAPLLCAGLIGYRSLKFCSDARRLGIYGFGAAAHIIAQVAKWQGREIYAFTRPGDAAAQALAKQVGAQWAGDSTSTSPVELDAAIIFAPVGALVPAALKAVRKGGVVVCGGIHMSDIPSIPYSLLWGERVVRSVANLTRQDAREFLALAGQVPIDIHVERFALHEANEALDRLRSGKLSGAAVLIM